MPRTIALSLMRFIDKLEDRINIVEQNPEAFPKSDIKENLYKCVITRQTSLYYTYDEHAIYILTIFDNRQNPGKFEEDVEGL